MFFLPLKKSFLTAHYMGIPSSFKITHLNYSLIFTEKEKCILAVVGATTLQLTDLLAEEA